MFCVNMLAMSDIAKALNSAYAQERAAWTALKQTGSDVDAANGHAAWLAAVEAANQLALEHPLAAEPDATPSEDHPA